jgi:hypothetical protein
MQVMIEFIITYQSEPKSLLAESAITIISINKQAAQMLDSPIAGKQECVGRI